MGLSTWIYFGWNQEIMEGETPSHEQRTGSKLSKTAMKKIQNVRWEETLHEDEKKSYIYLQAI